MATFKFALTLALSASALCGCFIFEAAEEVGLDVCDPTNPLHPGLSQDQDENCDYCGFVECEEDGGSGVGPFVCAPESADYDLCIQASAPYAGEQQYMIEVWESLDKGPVTVKDCEHAATYPGMNDFLAAGLTMFVCAREGGPDYFDESGKGSIMLVPGYQPLPPGIGSDYTEGAALPAGWINEAMTDVDHDVYEQGILCGEDGFTCQGSNYGCACLCDNDSGCENGFGHEIDSWICEGGLCLTEWAGEESEGGPEVYGLRRWEDGIHVDGLRITASPAVAVAATVDRGLWDDTHSFNIWTGEITACPGDSLCAYLGLVAGDVVKVDPANIGRALISGAYAEVEVAYVDGDSEIWELGVSWPPI